MNPFPESSELCDFSEGVRLPCRARVVGEFSTDNELRRIGEGEETEAVFEYTDEISFDGSYSRKIVAGRKPVELPGPEIEEKNVTPEKIKIMREKSY